MKKFLIVSAAPFEIAPLVQRFEKKRVDFKVAECGIGAITAATKADELRIAASGRHVLFVGTSGTFAPFTVPSLCTASRIVWLPTCERLGLGYGIPRGTLHEVRLPPAQTRSLTADLPEMTVVCSPSISLEAGFTDDLLKVLDPSLCVENLELFSCIRPLLDSADRVEIILGITNQIGPDAHEQWLKFHKNVAEMTADYIEEKL